MKDILILTDSRTHAAVDAIFDIAVHLSDQYAEGAVYVADRADPANGGLFYDFSNPGRTLSVLRVDPSYSFETHSKYEKQTIAYEDVRAVWIRIDHPVSDDFLRYVAAEFAGRKIFNDPEGIIETGTKAFLPQVADALGDLLAPLEICHTPEEIEAFKAGRRNIILKAVRGYGGFGIRRYRDDGDTDVTPDTDLKALLEELGPVLATEYLDPPVQQKDNRLLVFNGWFIGAFARIPKAGGWLCNISSGGSSEPAEPDARELRMIEILSPILAEKGVYFFGLDTLIDNKGRRVLSEINTLNVGGATELERLYGKPFMPRIAEEFIRLL